MSGTPLVSVVMSVLNDERHVAATLDSILSQEGVDLEFIVIDDGSTDRTGGILDDYAARDPRLRVVHQENTGLTRALIRGCELARGKYIARQDGGGDVSLPGRLRIQSDFLEANPDVLMVSCGTRFIGPREEEIYEAVQFGEELHRGLQEGSLIGLRGPSHHGSTVFRRSAYLEVGGYRAAFQVAQDLDLWVRLAEIGKASALPEIFYVARLTPYSIGSLFRNTQIETARIILACAKRRKAGLDDRPLFESLASRFVAKNQKDCKDLALEHAKFNYFIAGLLRNKSPRQAQYYYIRSLRSWRLFPKALLALCVFSLRK